MKQRTTKHPYAKSATSRLSQKYQIVIPKAIRVKLGLKRGDEVLITSLENEAVITKQPRDMLKAMRGLGKEVWASLGGAERYLEEERNSWDQ